MDLNYWRKRQYLETRGDSRIAIISSRHLITPAFDAQVAPATASQGCNVRRNAFCLFHVE